MLIKNTKRNFINNRNVNKITDNKSFWKSVKPSFTEKALKDEKNSTCWKRCNYFGRKRSCGDLSVLKRCENSKEHSDTILNAIKTFEKHPSILKIKELSCGCWFSFESVSFWRCQNRLIVIKKSVRFCEIDWDKVRSSINYRNPYCWL